MEVVGWRGMGNIVRGPVGRGTVNVAKLEGMKLKTGWSARR